MTFARAWTGYFASPYRNNLENKVRQCGQREASESDVCAVVLRSNMPE